MKSLFQKMTDDQKRHLVSAFLTFLATFATCLATMNGEITYSIIVSAFSAGIRAGGKVAWEYFVYPKKDDKVNP